MTINDRVPYTGGGEPLTVREPTRTWGTTSMPDPLSHPVDSLAALLEERTGVTMIKGEADYPTRNSSSARA